MQMTDSDFALNEWRQWLCGGGAVLYVLVHIAYNISMLWNQCAIHSSLTNSHLTTL